MGSAEGTLVRHPLSTASSQRTHARVALSPRRTLCRDRASRACVRRHSPVSPPPPPPARAPPLSPSSSGPRRSTGFDRRLTYVLTHSSAPPPEHKASPSSPPFVATPLHVRPRIGNSNTEEIPSNGEHVSRKRWLGFHMDESTSITGP
ncbi:hypothetical protein C4D60_Mb09t05570 [Musa balbisiana]|uniref:Uncharacterized protein n=1 Tax=Musa balbisiana TaxID=52838 RepID=A0A4V6T406_MUSBA|nr:hypothetical protein C4D60_Mb09t05570 [Musa balbisiana]